MKHLTNYIKGFLILILIQFLCTKIIDFTGIKLPAPILGIVIFGILLEFKIIKKDWVKDICDLLLSNMPLLFVPLFAGIIAYVNLIKENLGAIITNIVVTTILTLVISAVFVENVIKFVRLQKLKGRNNG